MLNRELIKALIASDTLTADEEHRYVHEFVRIGAVRAR